jgi:DnaT DNA-binding domain
MITISTLRAAGLTSEQIVRVLEVENEERLTRVRENNRERQRRHRARNAVTRDVRDIRDERDTLYKTQSPITESWSPSEESRERARAMGLGTEVLTRELERFRNHYLANGQRFANWDAKFLNWLTNPYQSKGQVNGHSEPRPFSREWRRERTAAALDALANFAGGGDPLGAPTPIGLPKPEGRP